MRARLPRTNLAAVEGHGEVGALGFSRSGEHRRNSLAHELHLGHVAAAPDHMQLGHGGTLARGDTPVLIGNSGESDRTRVGKRGWARVKLVVSDTWYIFRLLGGDPSVLVRSVEWFAMVILGEED